MLKFIFRNTTGSFFRTIGRIIAYIVLGFLISILFSKNVSAMSLTKVELMDANYKILRTLDSTQINDLTYASFPSTAVRRMRVYFSGLQVTAGYNYTAMIGMEARNSLILPETISGVFPYVSGVYQSDCSYTFYRKGSKSGTIAGTTYFDTYYEVYSNFNAITSGYILYLEFDLGSTWNIRGLGFPTNYLVANPQGGSGGGSSGGGSSSSDSNLGSEIQNSTNTIIDSNNKNANKITEEQKKTNEKLDEAQETRKGIWETIKGLPGKLLDMLKGLFIPDNFDFLNDFKETLENKLGFIAEVPISIIEFAFGLATATWEEFNSITFPSIEIFGVNFWNSQEISLQEAINIFRPYRYITDVICVVICVRTLRKWYEKFGSGGDAS